MRKLHKACLPSWLGCCVTVLLLLLQVCNMQSVLPELESVCGMLYVSMWLELAEVRHPIGLQGSGSRSSFTGAWVSGLRSAAGY